jgi:hypothetical protein
MVLIPYEMYSFLSKVKILRYIYNKYRSIKIFLRDYSFFSKRGTNCLVFMADGKILHGGLADRLYGIINAFAICKIKEIPFKLYFVYPFDIRVFLIPNEYNWIVERETISYSKRYSKVVIKIQEEGWYKWIKSHLNKQIHFSKAEKRD